MQVDRRQLGQHRPRLRPGDADQRPRMRLVRQRSRTGRRRSQRFHRVLAALRQDEELVRPRPDQRRIRRLTAFGVPAPQRRSAPCAALAMSAALPRRAITWTRSKLRISVSDTPASPVRAIGAGDKRALERAANVPGKLSHAGALHPDRRRRDCRVRHHSPRRAADHARGRSRRCVRGRVRRAPSPIHWSSVGEKQTEVT